MLTLFLLGDGPCNMFALHLQNYLHGKRKAGLIKGWGKQSWQLHVKSIINCFYALFFYIFSRVL